MTDLPRRHLRRNGRDLDLPLQNVLFGRAADCHVRLESGLVSRRHARLFEIADGLVIEDLGSRNGVLVNQRRIQAPTLLYHGDVITIGLESFEVVDPRLLNHPANLSTLPPASWQHAESDVTTAATETVVAQLDVLTAREREVMELVVLGHTQKEIAERLHISVKTIETHRARLGEKLGCRTRAELVSYAISAGLLRSSNLPPLRTR
jgi:DNA-binding CsgD family transcriptional regulator